MRWDRQNLFVIAGISLWGGGVVIAGFVSTYFTVILPGFHVLFVIAGFVLAGFVIAWFVSTYFTVILPGFHMLFVIAGFVIMSGVRYSGIPQHMV